MLELFTLVHPVKSPPKLRIQKFLAKQGTWELMSSVNNTCLFMPLSLKTPDVSGICFDPLWIHPINLFGAFHFLTKGGQVKWWPHGLAWRRRFCELRFLAEFLHGKLDLVLLALISLIKAFFVSFLSCFAQRFLCLVCKKVTFQVASTGHTPEAHQTPNGIFHTFNYCSPAVCMF